MKNIILTVLVAIALSSCSSVSTKKYYESGQIQEETVKTGVIFSDGKTFVVKP